MRNARLAEAEVGIKISGRNINNFRYADDTTLMAENKEELKSLLMKVKEDSEKVGLKLNMANRYGSNGKVRDFIFLGSKISEDCDYSHEIKRRLLPVRKAMTNLDSRDIKKQRHYFANKGPSSQSYGFSSNCVWM